MKQLFILVLAGTLLLPACGPEKGIEVHSAWMRPAAQGENSAVYFVIHNHTASADELVGASLELAEAVEIHQSMTIGADVMQMHEMASVPLPGFGETEFAPGGLHIMLVRLKQEARAGDEVELILHFRNYDDLRLTVPVSETPVEESH